MREAIGASTAFSHGAPRFLDFTKCRVFQRRVNSCKFLKITVSSNDRGQVAKTMVQNDEQQDFQRRILTASQNADDFLLQSGISGISSRQECCQLIEASVGLGKIDLAFSILEAMRKKCDQGWPEPDASTFAVFVKSLASALRVSDAIRAIEDLRGRGVPSSDEVKFGKVVNCPTCNVALAVVKPECGSQIVACCKCRYRYELISGDIVSCESESISANASAFERGLRFLQLMKRPIPAAVHSFIVKDPGGVGVTLRFATQSSEVPGQVGERVTIVLASPSRQGPGFIPIAARTPGWQPSEPMAVTNHVTRREMSLLRAPPKNGSKSLDASSFVVPAAIFLASSNAATALIDPTLPRAIAVGAGAVVVAGGLANAFVLPRFNQIPSRTAEVIALKQDLLAQYEVLQARLEEVTSSSIEEVRTLARLSQLRNKMESVGEDIYSARIGRISKAVEGIDDRLNAQLELIDSYAKIASMIEIEVEMDMEFISAEASGAVATIEEQIRQVMEVEEIQKRWKIQAEAADEVERLLSTDPA